jgi:hypothetical protein
MTQPSGNSEFVDAMTCGDSRSPAAVARLVYWSIYLRNRKGDEAKA